MIAEIGQEPALHRRHQVVVRQRRSNNMYFGMDSSPSKMRG
jgi:hypothetical protein